jgi:hypothetical protein
MRPMPIQPIFVFSAIANSCAATVSSLAFC